MKHRNGRNEINKGNSDKMIITITITITTMIEIIAIVKIKNKFKIKTRVIRVNSIIK